MDLPGPLVDDGRVLTVKVGSKTVRVTDAAKATRLYHQVVRIGDLRDFEFEQAAHQVAVAARKDHLDPRADLLDFEHHRADAIADVVDLTTNLLGTRQDAFHVVAEVDNHRVAFEPLHGAVDDVADLLLEFLVQTISLGLAHLDVDALLDRLGENAPFFLERNFVVELPLPRAAVDAHLEVLDAVLLGQSGRDCLLDRLEQTFTVDLFVAGERVDVAEDLFGSHSSEVEAEAGPTV